MPRFIPNEAYYDAAIAPMLNVIAGLCAEKGISFIAVAEYIRPDQGVGHGVTRLDMPFSSGLTEAINELVTAQASEPPQIVSAQEVVVDTSAWTVDGEA